MENSENNIGASGMVKVHQPEAYLQLHYYDDVTPKPETPLGNYYEKLRLKGDGEENTLSVEIGKLAKSDIPSHREMWDKAIHYIKVIAEGK